MTTKCSLKLFRKPLSPLSGGLRDSRVRGNDREGRNEQVEGSSIVLAKKAKGLLRYVLCIQLAFYPVYSFSDNASNVPPNGDSPVRLANAPEGTAPQDNALSYDFLKAQVDVTEAFNKKVEGLNQHIFGPRAPSEHYTDHPLDFYSLIGQKVEQQRAGFWERRNPWYAETKAFLKGAAFRGSPPSGEDVQQESSKKESQPKAPEHSPRPFFTKIHIENLVVNIVTTIESQSKAEPNTAPQEVILARINSQGDKINSLAKGPPSSTRSPFSGPFYSIQEEGGRHLTTFFPKYAGKSFIPNTSQFLYNFNISYQGQVLHRFSNNIQWISFFGPYLVFQEKSRIYENKAELSFIDLSYFRSAIGKTALPVFHIPIDLTLKSEIQTDFLQSATLGDSPTSRAHKKKEAFLLPENIYINPQALAPRSAEDPRRTGQGIRQPALTLIGSGDTKYEVHLSEIDEVSRVQQILFNVLVSMLKTNKYERDMLPFFKEIAHTMENLLQSAALEDSRPSVIRVKNHANSNQSPATGQEQIGPRRPSESILKQVVAELLHNRVDIGSPSHHAGHYG